MNSLDTVGNLTEEQEKLHDRFEAGLVHYRNQEWDAAQQCWEECLAIAPEDKPTQLFLERNQYLREHPPSEDWQGIWPE